MLKVVGASSVQTRVTLLTLGVVTLFGILTYYYGGVSPTSHDGNYAATVFWSCRSGYRLQFWGQNNEPSSVRKGVARAYYKPDMSSDGWASLEIEGQKEWPDLVQAHAAGLLEGSLSWQLIYYHWKNTIERTCEDRQHFCDQVRIILNQNTANIREQAKALGLTDPFWHQMAIFRAVHCGEHTHTTGESCGSEDYIGQVDAPFVCLPPVEGHLADIIFAPATLTSSVRVFTTVDCSEDGHL